MRIEIVDDADSQAAACSFPPSEGHLDLRQNPHAVERIAAARQYLPLRNFLIAVNTAESVFATSAVAIECKLAEASGQEFYEFASRTGLVFAVPSLNFDRSHYKELVAGLKELLERESGDALRGVLRIFPCRFAEQSRDGFCLSIELAAQGNSSKQAELRWGLGLARVQQALLFRARALGQQIGA